MQFLITPAFDGPNESNILNYGICWLSGGVYYAQNASGTFQYPMSQYPDIYIGEVLDENLPPNYALTIPMQQAYSYDPIDFFLYPTPIGPNRLMMLRRLKMVEVYENRNYGYYINHFVYNGHCIYFDSRVMDDMDIILRHILAFNEWPENTPAEWVDIYGAVVPLPTVEDFKDFYKTMNNRRLEIRNIFHELSKSKSTNMTTYVDYYAMYGAEVPNYFLSSPSTPTIINDLAGQYPPVA